MRDHAKLKVFELADDIAIEVYRISLKFPKEEIYGLTSQMRRAAVSVPSNIVEGCARETQSDYVRFLTIAFGSLRELHYHIGLAARLCYLDSQDMAFIEHKVIEAEKMLNKLIRVLKQGQAEAKAG
jgi:four helix bundle protein